MYIKAFRSVTDLQIQQHYLLKFPLLPVKKKGTHGRQPGRSEVGLEL